MKYPWYVKFITWWFGLTTIYLMLVFFTQSLVPVKSALNPITFFIGLFVPYGFWNAAFTHGHLLEGSVTVLISAVMAFVCLLCTDMAARKLGITSPFKKIIFNLVILLALTAFVDYSLWGEWVSINLFLGRSSPGDI